MNKPTDSHPNSSQDEKEKDKTSSGSETVNPEQDLVYTSSYDKDPEELLSNPAVVPQTYDEKKDLR